MKYTDVVMEIIACMEEQGYFEEYKELAKYDFMGFFNIEYHILNDISLFLSKNSEVELK